jgi:hypothetical protein
MNAVGVTEEDNEEDGRPRRDVHGLETLPSRTKTQDEGIEETRPSLLFCEDK